jgi:glutathione S-transferase
MIHYLPELVTLLTVFLMFGTMYAVGRARAKYGVQAPAISGHPAFERAYRVQMNTLESTVMFLPVLWMAGHFGFELWAGIAGIVWIIGRVWYAVAYLNDASKRGPGYMIGFVGWAALVVLAIVGLARAIMVS